MAWTYEEHEEAFQWASSLGLSKLHWMVTVLASDLDALHPLNAKAVLEVVALRLGAEVKEKEDRIAAILERGLGWTIGE